MRRQRASAGEIFAAALQDYGRRGVVGGKNTFGGGTLQTIVLLGRVASVPGRRSHDDEPNIYRLSLDTAHKPNLQLIMYPGKLAEAKAKAGATKVSPEAAPDDDTDTIGAADDTKEPVLDPERDETLNILADLVDLSRGPKTASTNVKKSAEQRP